MTYTLMRAHRESVTCVGWDGSGTYFYDRGKDGLGGGGRAVQFTAALMGAGAPSFILYFCKCNSIFACVPSFPISF